MTSTDWLVSLGILVGMFAFLLHSLWYEAGVRRDKARAAQESTPAE